MSTAEVPWKEFHEEQKHERSDWKEINLADLRSTTLRFQTRNGGDVVLIRSSAYPPIDFYPSRNKWRIEGKTVVGTAKDLINYLKVRTMK